MSNSGLQSDHSAKSGSDKCKVNEFVFKALSLFDKNNEIILLCFICFELNEPLCRNLSLVLIREFISVGNNEIKSMKRSNEIKVDINF